MFFIFCSSASSIRVAPGGALKPNAVVETLPPACQFRIWMLYCGPSGTRLDVMTYRQG